MPQRVLALVGTRKAAFIYTSDAQRRNWQVSDPIMTGWTTYHMAADTRRDPPRLYAASSHFAWGPCVARSDDGGKTWEQRSPGLKFPEGSGQSIQSIWHVAPGLPSEPGVVYAGTQPAGMFRSEDWGESWAPVDAINNHPAKQYWSGTGGGDSCMNSIEIDPRDPKTISVAISSGGSYRTTDGGATWKIISASAVPQTAAAREFTEQVSKEFPGEPRPDMDPFAIDEMHKMRLDPKNPDRIWAQAHVGVFRTDDNGVTWHDVTEGLPSFHGFPIAITRREPDAAYVVPLAFAGMYDNFRVCPGQFTVYRTNDAGKSWQPLTDGLPGPNDYQSVYREGLDTDGLDPEGVYVGTTNGEVYASADRGDHWSRLPGTLPPILSVTAAVVG